MNGQTIAPDLIEALQKLRDAANTYGVRSEQTATEVHAVVKALTKAGL